jgi:glucose-6-phosphate 1-epimerase
MSPAFAPTPGTGGLPKLALAAADGARAEVYLHGAHVTSWIPADDADDRLFLSARSRFGPGEAIRGGIPVCFPQFASQGPLANHGFGRVSVWELVRAERTAAGAARAVLRLRDSPATRAQWPHAFALELTVTVAGRTLELTLAVSNAGTAAFEFTGALHTYLRVADVRRTVVRGLRNARYRDKALATDGNLESGAALAFDREIDRVYYAAPQDLAADEPGRTVAVRAIGFPDTVVWNPGPQRGAALGDLEENGYLRMLCVEAAVSRAPVTVEAGEGWRGSQSLTSIS